MTVKAVTPKTRKRGGSTGAKKARKGSKRGRGNTPSWKRPFRRIPSYLLWALLAVVVVAYVFFFYKTFVSPYSFRWKAIYGEVTYPSGKVRGIDISHYQGDIDWEKLRNADIQGAQVCFVFVKATEGSDRLDEKFNQNFFNARKNEILRGAYHFFSTKSTGKEQAKYFCKMVQLEDDDLPPVLDVEQIGDYTPGKLRKEVGDWLRIVEKNYGVKPILYTSYKFRMSYLNTEEIDRYPYWIAHYYVDSLQYKGAWSFWQHTDAGRVDGIKHYVDVNLFNGSYEDLLDMTLRQARKSDTEPEQ